MKGPKPVAPEMRFWRHVHKIEDEDSCWEWTASRNVKSGYGQFGIKYGVMVGAHRFSWALHNGDIVDGLWVLHKCDNRGCVRPDHLFLGTHKDNMADMAKKDRGHNPSTKLTSGQVREIRARRSAGASLKVLAAEYGVADSCISRIANRVRWSSLP